MNCCEKPKKEKKEKGFLKGILYGLAPHVFCILFIILSVLGATTATTLLKPLLLNPYFFYILIAISFIFATISAIFYFRHLGFIILDKTDGGLELSILPTGIKRKWKYLLTLYGTTIGINLLLFMVIFPITANLDSGTTLTAAIRDAFGGDKESQLSESASLITLQVAIPCPGHAPLITTELKKISGVENVKFRFPNLFDVSYNPQKTTKEEILSLEVFNTYKATIINEQKGSVVESTVNLNNIRENRPLTGGYAVGGCGCGAR